MDIHPCWYCGSEKVHLTTGAAGNVWVYCQNCSSGGPGADSGQEAIRLWNSPRERDLDLPFRKAAAIAALNGILASCWRRSLDPSDAAKWAKQASDALLKEFQQNE